MVENVKFSFLCIFIIASSHGCVLSFASIWRVKKKLPQGEASQNAYQRSMLISLKVKKNIRLENISRITKLILNAEIFS